MARFSRHLIYAMFSKNSRCAHGSQVSIPQLIYLAFKIARTQKKNNYLKAQHDLLLLNNVINSIINAKKSMKQHLSFDQTVSHVAKEFPPDQTAFTWVPPPVYRNRKLKLLGSGHIQSFKHDTWTSYGFRANYCGRKRKFLSAAGGEEEMSHYPFPSSLVTPS